MYEQYANGQRKEGYCTCADSDAKEERQQDCSGAQDANAAELHQTFGNRKGFLRSSTGV